MSISSDKLSEILSVYQQISAYSLGGPALLHGYMMPTPNGTANAAGTFVMPTTVPNKSATSSGALVPARSTTSVSSSLNEQQNRAAAAAAAAAVITRQSQASERRESMSSTIDPDQDETEVEMMQFEGDAIPAFAVGGERRLYMPMLLRRLLQRGFDDGAIHAACEELKIHFQEATNEQMDALRRTLQAEVPLCGLIKRSDAERLWALLDEASVVGDKLLDADMRPSAVSSQSDLAACPSGGSSRTPSGSCSPTTATSERFGDLPTANSFRVYHACFGKQKGIFVPELYTSPDARCIVCVRCGAHCSPERFVTHVHRATAENNVAHWGFDPAKWRAYLLLSKDQHASKELRDYFESLKCKFDASRKRKVCSVALAQPTPATTPAPLGQPRRAASPVDAICKKRKLDAVGEQLACSATATSAAARPPQTDFRQVPANVTLPAESVTIAQAALASARATTSTGETPSPNENGNSVNTNSVSVAQQPNVSLDGTISTIFLRELQALQEAQERELKTLRDLVDGRTLSTAEANDFLTEATALRRRQFALLSGVMYESVLLKQQVKTTKESSERALAAFAAENGVLRSERRKIEEELVRLRTECARLRNELGERERIVQAARTLTQLYDAPPARYDPTATEASTNEGNVRLAETKDLSPEDGTISNSEQVRPSMARLAQTCAERRESSTVAGETRTIETTRDEDDTVQSSSGTGSLVVDGKRVKSPSANQANS